jgi:uncharacterized protein (DUF302 family)
MVMMTQTTTNIGMHVQLNQPYEVAMERVKEALKAEGFGVLTEINVQATLKQKIGADFRRYAILGACNPSLAHRALSADLEVGLLLPCNVVVYETSPQESIVALANPVAMAGMLADASFGPIADEAQQRLIRVAEALRQWK